MIKVTSPMGLHLEGLHDGHRAVLEYAKQFGDRIVVPIVPQIQHWYTYLSTGRYLINKKYSKKELEAFRNEIKEIRALGAFPRPFHLNPVPEEKRQEWQVQAEEVIKDFENQILTPAHRQIAIAVTAGVMRDLAHPKSGSVKYTVRGPEFHNFVLKYVKEKIHSHVEVKIYPNIIKDPVTHIRMQGSQFRIDSGYVYQSRALGSVVGGIRPYFKVGLNPKIVSDVNGSYGDIWKLKDIIVLEGGIIPGRLEIVQFVFPKQGGGSIIIDDVKYHG